MLSGNIFIHGICLFGVSLQPEMGMGAGLGKASPQMVEISLVEHAVFEEGQLLEEHLRHAGH